MRNPLTSIQLEYVLDHLGHHAELSGKLRSFIHYGEPADTRDGAPGKEKSLIFFPASRAALDLNKLIWIDEIPILYPLEEKPGSFYSFADNRLYFHHDLLKSIFHLLSGYQEIANPARDQYGRFPYRESIQFKLGIIEKPVVNYYMEIIVSGLREFCKKNAIPFEDKSPLNGPVLMLSHDVDLIDAYSFKETGFKFKQLIGLADSPYNSGGKMREAFTALYHFLNPFSKHNPYWNFAQLTAWERERDFLSTYYFLEKDGRYDNSTYSFHSPRIRKLIGELSEKGYEVGIHGTMQSYDDPDAMNRTVEHLRRVAPGPVRGIRQHYLRFNLSTTPQIQAQAGLAYDASLGFAEFDGFRNSYCWPFRFFDFQNNRAMDYWEIPLTVMDVTHFYYRRLDFEQSKAAMERLIADVARFRGVFSLLWHNSFFNEYEFPGITSHYLQILNLFKSRGMDGITGSEIIERMNRN